MSYDLSLIACLSTMTIRVQYKLHTMMLFMDVTTILKLIVTSFITTFLGVAFIFLP